MTCNDRIGYIYTPGGGGAMKIACLLLLSLSGVACEEEREGVSPPPHRPVLQRNEEGAQFSREEEELIGTIARFYAGLTTTFTSLDPVGASPLRMTRHLEAYTDAQRPLISAWTARYRALPPARREALHRAVFRRNEAAFVAFVKAASRWSEVLRQPEMIPTYRGILRTLLEAWAKEDALWVFEGFGEEAVRELREVALGEEGGGGRRSSEGRAPAPAGER